MRNQTTILGRKATLKIVTALYDFHVLFQVVRVHTMNRGYPYKSREKVRKIVLAEINSRYTGVKRY